MKRRTGPVAVSSSQQAAQVQLVACGRIIPENCSKSIIGEIYYIYKGNIRPVSNFKNYYNTKTMDTIGGTHFQTKIKITELFKKIISMNSRNKMGINYKNHHRHKSNNIQLNVIKP